MLCCWFAGTYEGSADIRIICSRLEKGALAWTEPVDISGDPERSEQNPSLFYGPDNAVWAMYTAQKDRQAGKDNMHGKEMYVSIKNFAEYQTIPQNCAVYSVTVGELPYEDEPVPNISATLPCGI